MFVNPCIPLTFTSTINSELGDVFIDSVTFIITGLSQLEQADILIFPNPTSGIIVLDFETVRQNVSLQITDILGKKVFSQYQFKQILKKEISISTLKSGSYIFMINADDIKYSKIIFKQ